MKISYKIKDFGETFEVEIDDGFISGLWKDGKDVMDDQDEDYLTASTGWQCRRPGNRPKTLGLNQSWMNTTAPKKCHSQLESGRGQFPCPQRTS